MSRLSLCLLFLASLIIGSSAFYGKKDDVVELTTANFNSEVLQSDDVWLVEFYAPWCGHCKSLTPEYKKVAKQLKGIAKVGAVDMTKHESFGRQYDVKGFPTIKLFVRGSQPQDYQGARTADAMADFVKREVRARENLKGGKDSSSKSSKKSKSSKSDSAAKVVDLTESTFEAAVLQSDDLWLVEFFAPWCGHCKNLEPHWKEAASKLGGVAKLGAVDATVYQNLATKYGVKGYPTIKVFKPGKKSAPEDYQGGRTASDIITYAKDLAETDVPPKRKPVTELTNSEAFNEGCSESTCIIAVLPHILDSGAKGRNNYLNTLKSISQSNAHKPFSFGWIEIGSQPEFEQALAQEFGGIAFPPAIVAVNVKKARHVMMTGAFSEAGINDFISTIVNGNVRTVPLTNTDLAATLTERAVWDGKDAPKPASGTETESDSERDL